MVSNYRLDTYAIFNKLFQFRFSFPRLLIKNIFTGQRLDIFQLPSCLSNFGYQMLYFKIYELITCFHNNRVTDVLFHFDSDFDFIFDQFLVLFLNSFLCLPDVSFIKSIIHNFLSVPVELVLLDIEPLSDESNSNIWKEYLIFQENNHVLSFIVIKSKEDIMQAFLNTRIS